MGTQSSSTPSPCVILDPSLRSRVTQSSWRGEAPNGIHGLFAG